MINGLNLKITFFCCMSAILIWPSTVFSENEYLRQVCDAIQNHQEKQICLRDVRRQERRAAEADTRQLKITAAEERNTRKERLEKWKLDSNYPVYGSYCGYDFDCWLSLIHDHSYRQPGWSACKREIKNAAGDRKWRGRQLSESLNSYLHNPNLHPMVVGYKGVDLEIRSQNGVWERKIFLCNYDYAEQKVLELQIKPLPPSR
ncbi:hypothetical protein ACFVYJ_01385 [Pontibacter sp. JAM-7]|uniref:hypothetical protein n=1 Tax=Pontibacter sp. JAM-7 TaxID=3366581 RepID=UPI003AF5C236